MEKLIDPMSTVRPHDRKPRRLSVLLDDIANVSETCVRPTNLDGFVKALARVVYQFQRGCVHIPHGVGLVKIAMKSVMKNGHIDVHDIAILQGSHIRNPVANNLVDRSNNSNYNRATNIK